MANTSVHFDRDQIRPALNCLAERGYCVIREMLSRDIVSTLKDTIDAALDPERDLAPASNRYHMTFAEVCLPLLGLAIEDPYRAHLHNVHGTSDLCLHRSAAILRTAGEPMGTWHTDHRGHVEAPRTANDVLNRFPIPSGSWFYLNGSHPERSGIAVIEGSHVAGWTGPEGFELTPDRSSFHRLGEPEDSAHTGMDVPGCVAVEAEPGDLICFASLTYHTNMATHERRYSCGISFRPKAWQVDAPWPLPAGARTMIEALPAELRGLTDGYTSFDGSWSPANH